MCAFVWLCWRVWSPLVEHAAWCCCIRISACRLGAAALTHVTSGVTLPACLGLSCMEEGGQSLISQRCSEMTATGPAAHASTIHTDLCLAQAALTSGSAASGCIVSCIGVGWLGRFQPGCGQCMRCVLAAPKQAQNKASADWCLLCVCVFRLARQVAWNGRCSSALGQTLCCVAHMSG